MKTLEDVLRAAGKSRRVAAQRAEPGRTSIPACRPSTPTGATRQQAWQKTCVLFNLSFHMADLYVEGPDATKLLSYLAINTFKNVSPGRAKQFVPCSYDGHVIGDVILFNSAAEQVRPGRPHPGAELDHLPRADRQVRRQARARRALGGAQGSVRPQAVPLPDPGSERDEDHGEGARREAAGGEVLPHHDADHRRQDR